MKQKIITYLQNKYKPEVILLGGSRAKNTERKNSDWDIYLIGDYKNENETISEEFLDEHLDVALFPKSCLKDNVLRIFYGPINDLKVLLDNQDKLGLKIANSSKEAYLNKPESLSTTQILEKINYLNRIISKIEGYKNDPEISFFHLAQFYQAVIPFWFEFNREWSIPVHRAIPIIKSKDSIFYDLLKSISTTNIMEEKIESCKKIVEYYKNKNK